MIATGDAQTQDGLVEVAANVCDVTIAFLTQHVDAGLPDREADAATIITL